MAKDIVERMDTSEHCKYHRETMLRIERLEKEAEKMRADISSLTNSSIPIPVIVAGIALFGTIMTTLGGLAGVAMNIFAKSMGWV